MAKLSCFKAYDIRGRIPDELNDTLAYQIGQAYAAFVKPKTVAVGRDIRQTVPVAGSFVGATNDFLGMTVEVQVRNVTANSVGGPAGS